MTERQQEDARSEEDGEANKVTCTGMARDTPMGRSRMEVMVGNREDEGDNGLARFGRRGGEHHEERKEANLMVETTQAKEHGW